MDSLYFNELKMKETFETAIADFYKNDYRHADEEDYWFKVFGNREIKFYSSLTEANTDEEKPHFPCVVISIYSTPDTQWSNSTEIEEVSLVSFSIELFSTKVNDIQSTTLSYLLSNIIILALRNVSGNITISKNAPLLNFDKNVSRRILRGSFKYNNRTNTFYKGE